MERVCVRGCLCLSSLSIYPDNTGLCHAMHGMAFNIHLCRFTVHDPPCFFFSFHLLAAVIEGGWLETRARSFRCDHFALCALAQCTNQTHISQTVWLKPPNWIEAMRGAWGALWFEAFQKESMFLATLGSRFQAPDLVVRSSTHIAAYSLLV